jgi:hypothetical protein
VARLYRQAADQGHAKAQCNLAACYRDGDGVRQDKAQAARLYRQAAEQGLAKAQHNLGICYEHDKGVRYDVGEAVALYRMAIARGCEAANLSFGLCFEKGRGVPLDRAEAERLYQLAVRSDDAHAAHAFSLTSAYIGTLDGATTSPSHVTAPAVALQLTCDAVYELNLGRWFLRKSDRFLGTGPHYGMRQKMGFPPHPQRTSFFSSTNDHPAPFVRTLAPMYTALGLTSLDLVIFNWKLRWAGHVRRMDWSRLARKFFTSWVDAPRCRGRAPSTGTTSRASSS